MGNIKIGRTIAERREQLESSSERIAAQKKGKKKKTIRIVLAVLLYVFLAGVLAFGIFMILKGNDVSETVEIIKVPVTPTIEVVDEDAGLTGGMMTSRMSEYIGLVENDFRELGYTPTKAVIPMGSVREVDFYFSDFEGYVKTVVDRGAGVTAEDFGRMIKYLQGIDEMDFEYIDIRVEEKGYWK